MKVSYKNQAVDHAFAYADRNGATVWFCDASGHITRVDRPRRKRADWAISLQWGNFPGAAYRGVADRGEIACRPLKIVATVAWHHRCPLAAA